MSQPTTDRNPLTKAPTVSRCVRFATEPIADTEIKITLANQCEVPISCSVSWKVICGKDPAQNFSENSDLAPGQSSDHVASAASCGPGRYEITAPSWKCHADAPLSGSGT